MNLIRLRFLAVTIDLTLVAAVAFLVKKLLLVLWPLSEGAGTEYPWIVLPLTSFGYLGLALLMYGICGGIFRASPGKRLLKLRITPTDGQPLGFFRAMFREHVRLIEIVFFISAFFSFLNLLESRPTTTDSLFRTCVRDTRR